MPQARARPRIRPATAAADARGPDVQAPHAPDRFGTRTYCHWSWRRLTPRWRCRRDVTRCLVGSNDETLDSVNVDVGGIAWNGTARCGQRLVRRSVARGCCRAAGDRPIPQPRRVGEGPALFGRRTKLWSPSVTTSLCPFGKRARAGCCARSAPTGFTLTASPFPPTAHGSLSMGCQYTDGDRPGFQDIRWLVDAVTGKEIRRLPAARYVR